jgi:hypothetical protein
MITDNNTDTIFLVEAKVALSTLTKTVPSSGRTHFGVEEEGSHLLRGGGLYKNVEINSTYTLIFAAIQLGFNMPSPSRLLFRASHICQNETIREW